MSKRLEAAITAYYEAFQVAPPMPASVADDVLAEVLEKAAEDGAPVPEDFDFWSYVPRGAVA